MAGITSMLSYYGRLTLVNSLLSSLPMYWLSTIKFPKSVIKQIDGFRKNCLWNRHDIHRQGKCLVAWTVACPCKEEGGLGILNLRAQNKALLLKFAADKFYNKADTPWVQLTWQAFYNGPFPPHMKRPVGSFWWRDVVYHWILEVLLPVWCRWGIQYVFGKIFGTLACSSFSILSSSLLLVTIEFLLLPSWYEVFAENIHFPLSIIASQQLTQLEDHLHTLLINSDSDQWSYIWGISFISKKHAYKALMGSFQKLKPHQWLWKSSCQGKHKFFFWLLMC